MWVDEMPFDYEFSLITVIERRWKETRENTFLKIVKTMI
jgi:hypothetical protein